MRTVGLRKEKDLPIFKIFTKNNHKDEIHMIGASTNPKKLTLKKDLTCMTDCVNAKQVFLKLLF